MTLLNGRNSFNILNSKLRLASPEEFNSELRNSCGFLNLGGIRMCAVQETSED